MEEKNPIQVADRIFAVLERLAEKGAVGLIELSKELKLNKSTVHRLLNSLMYMGYVKQDEETLKYELTYKICRVADSLMSQIDLIQIAKPYLKELSRKTGETVHLVEREGNKAVYIDKVENSTNAVRLVSKIGKTIPLYCSGVGKAMMAEMSEEKIRQIWNESEIIPYTEMTIMDIEELLGQIEVARQKGYAMDDEENEIGVRCVAVALPDMNGKNRYAISISAPEIRMTDEKIKICAKALKEAKRKIKQAWS